MSILVLVRLVARGMAMTMSWVVSRGLSLAMVRMMMVVLGTIMPGKEGSTGTGTRETFRTHVHIP
jgi:hypothetical protein